VHLHACKIFLGSAEGRCMLYYSSAVTICTRELDGRSKILSVSPTVEEIPEWVNVANFSVTIHQIMQQLRILANQVNCFAHREPHHFKSVVIAKLLDQIYYL
jgi:hypothetical protein